MNIHLTKIQKIISAQEIHVLVLLSLSLQVILIFLAIARKRSANKFLGFVLWSAYLGADYVATLGLGYLLYKGDPSGRQRINSDLISFWAPFLLLHLGGPDTITSYSLEDNELWWRHLLGLIVQVSVAILVLIESHPSHRLWKATIPVFILGVLKFGERTLCLRSASMDQLRESTLVKPDPGPNYVKFMEEYTSRRNAGLPARIETAQEPAPKPSNSDDKDPDVGEMELIIEAYKFFKMVKLLTADLMLSFRERIDSQSFFLKQTYKNAFKVVEIELSFLYDIFHTKATHIHYLGGRLLRCCSLSMNITALLLFHSTSKEGWYNSTSKEGSYEKIDVKITYALLYSAIGLETVSFVLLILSDWTIVSLDGIKLNKLARTIYKIVSFFLPFGKPRWSNSINQYKLITFCLNDKRNKLKKFLKFVKLKILVKLWNDFWYLYNQKVSDYMKEYIFNELKEKARNAEDPNSYKRLRNCRGEWALQQKGYTDFEWSVLKEFDESILLWHIATDLCYHTSEPISEKKEDESIVKIRKNELDPKTKSLVEISKIISDYMLYLLVFQPAMMPIGIGKIRFQDTCSEAKRFFETKKPKMMEEKACDLLLAVPTVVPPAEVKGDRSKSVLFDSCRLAKQLRDLNDAKMTWEIVSAVWVEILSYAAANCRSYNHAKQLSKGGELLTHVWLLMVHMGMGEQYRIEEGHARAKLIVELGP